MRSLSFCFVLFALACEPLGPSPIVLTPPQGIDTSLAEVKRDPNMAIEFEGGDGLGAFVPPNVSPPFSVTLGSWSHLQNVVCVTLPAQTTASALGHTLTAESLGVVSEQVCEVPQWTLPSMIEWPDDTVSVVFQDNTERIEADFLHAGAQRGFQIAGPTGGVLRTGETVTLKLYPGTDTFPGPIGIGWIRACFDSGGGEVDLPNSDCYALAVEGNTATFTVPAGYTSATGLYLTELGSVGVSRCDVAHCDLVFHVMTPEVAIAVK